MILDLLKYFAKYPQKEGVQALFVKGSSDIPGYAELLAIFNALPTECIMPEIGYLVYGQSFDGVKDYLAKLIGSPVYLLVDFGEISSNRDNRNSLQDTQKMALTVAMCMPDSPDLIEETLASEITLQLTNKLRAHMMADDETKTLGTWMNLIRGSHQLAPFVAKELKSIGWTILFNTSATDMLDVSTLAKAYNS